AITAPSPVSYLRLTPNRGWHGSFVNDPRAVNKQDSTRDTLPRGRLNRKRTAGVHILGQRME
ncbi:MAG: hypothetical protein WB662_07320, partial [Methyloceanibacter sp.]